MTKKYYVYEIQAFAYSDFMHHILLHEKQFSDIKFRKMIEKSRQKAKELSETTEDFYWKYNYPMNVITLLKKDYGFIDSEHLVGYVGCHFDDICEVEKE